MADAVCVFRQRPKKIIISSVRALHRSAKSWPQYVRVVSWFCVEQLYQHTTLKIASAYDEDNDNDTPTLTTVFVWANIEYGTYYTISCMPERAHKLFSYGCAAERQIELDPVDYVHHFSG